MPISLPNSRNSRISAGENLEKSTSSEVSFVSTFDFPSSSDDDDDDEDGFGRGSGIFLVSSEDESGKVG